MRANNLIKNNRYLYTAGYEPIEATYLYETINGYMFEADSVSRILSIMEVKLHVEEIN
ncbi:MAG: hypothetical protein LBQ74_18130 [Prevotella sp.]|nr:hypothetical protein [Prevotella sp.]